MATRKTKGLGWLVALVVVAVLGAGLWYSYHRGWLTAAYHRLTGGKGGKAEHGGMGMNMGGGQPTESSGVPGLAVVRIAPELQQQIGVTTGEVQEEPLRMSVRTVGIVRPNEERVARVHLRTEGWIKDVFVNFTGKHVKQGAKLLSIYSPQFLTTQQDYLRALRANDDSLAQLARERLRLWDVPDKEIDDLKGTRKPQTYLALRSPIGGTVLEKNVFEDQYVTPKAELYVVADLSTVWVQAKVYEYELPHVEVDQPARVTLPALPGKELTGKVVFIQPTVEEPARTVQVRVVLPNKDGQLKPGMFAHVVIEHGMGKGLLVPASAVIRTGTRDYAFRQERDNRFAPVLVTISPFRFGGRYHVLSGLHAGDRVVTSADFLVDSESRLRFGGMGGMPGMNMSGMKKQKKGGNMKDHGAMHR